MAVTRVHKSLFRDYSEEKNKGKLGSAQHQMRLLKKNDTYHFFKVFHHNQEFDIRSELLIAEFIRILVPREPVTDIIFNDEKDSSPVGLLSEKIEGFRSLDSLFFLKLAYLLLTNSITGFGEICTLLMLTCEHDGKICGNIGINSKKEIVKLDGGETMLAKYDHELSIRYPITEKDINRLPLPPAFVKKRGINWLYGNAENNSVWFLFWLLSWKKNIRHEINFTLLKFILLPDSFIQDLIHNLGSADCYPVGLIQQFKQRIDDTRQMAIKNSSFRMYVMSLLAKEDLEKYIKHLTNFTLSNKIKMIKSTNIQDEINQDFQALVKSAKIDKPSYYLSFKIGAGIVMLLVSALVLYLMDFPKHSSKIFPNRI